MVRNEFARKIQIFRRTGLLFEEARPFIFVMEEHNVAIIDGADLVVCSLLDFCTSLLFMVDISKLLKFSGSLFFYFLIEHCLLTCLLFLARAFGCQFWIQLTHSIQLNCLRFSNLLMVPQCSWFAHGSPIFMRD